jgi:hypothetical protein
MTAQTSIAIFIAYHFDYHASQRTIYSRLVTLKVEPCERIDLPALRAVS